VAVYSTTVNDGYKTLSGTSMASPHLVGATALLWSAVPELVGRIDMTEQVLIKSTIPVSDSGCGDSDDPLVPNNIFGYGRLNALQAIELAQHPAELTVQVTQIAEHGTAEIPLPGIGISLTDLLTGYVYETVTGSGGKAVLPQVLAGNYQLQASSDDGPLITTELEFDQDIVRLEGDATQDNTLLRYSVAGTLEGEMKLFWPIIQNSD
jgi:subtilisin family serine protease